MNFKDNVGKSALQSIFSSLRKVYLKIWYKIPSSKLRVQIFGKVSTVYSNLTLATVPPTDFCTKALFRVER